MTRIHTALISIAALFLAAPAAMAASGASCTVVDGPAGVGPFFVSAAQTGGGNLVILDPLDQELLWLPVDATALTRLTGAAASQLPEVHAVQVRAVPDDDLFIESARLGAIAPLDRGFNLRLEQAWEVVGSQFPDGRAIGATWIWEMLDGNTMVACSDLSGGDHPEEVALVRVARDASDRSHVLLERPTRSRLNLACRLSLPLIATLPDRSVYALIPGGSSEDGGADRQVRLYRAGPEDERAQTLGDAVGEWPIVPLDDRWDRYPWLMREFELAAAPVGLFGRGKWLYLLSRAPEGRGTAWRLTRIDPVSGDRGGTMRISSRANHLMIVPGAERWALIEKGPVLSFGSQELRRILWMPVAQLDEWRDGGVLCPGV